MSDKKVGPKRENFGPKMILGANKLGSKRMKSPKNCGSK